MNNPHQESEDLYGTEHHDVQPSVGVPEVSLA